MRKFPGRLVNFTWDYMDVSRFGSTVCMCACTYARTRDIVTNIGDGPAGIRVARIHAYSQQPSNFGVIQAIVLLDGIVGVSGIA